MCNWNNGKVVETRQPKQSVMLLLTQWDGWLPFKAVDYPPPATPRPHAPPYFPPSTIYIPVQSSPHSPRSPFMQSRAAVGGCSNITTSQFNNESTMAKCKITQKGSQKYCIQTRFAILTPKLPLRTTETAINELEGGLVVWRGCAPWLLIFMYEFMRLLSYEMSRTKRQKRMPFHCHLRTFLRVRSTNYKEQFF